MTAGVRSFLARLGHDQYYEMFVARGFDLESDICHINIADLECMYISDAVHRREILEAAKKFKPSEEFAVYEWLRDKGLDHYFINFVQSDLTDFDVISRLNLPDENIYDELEITLPGHKRRLERAVRQLSKKLRADPKIKEPIGVAAPAALTSGHVDAVELPLAYGRWGKPRCLLDAKYDFLVLDAKVSSTIDPRNTANIEFMVDSGSDVVTIREQVLESLDLELIGPIRSKGVHAARTKNLYRANIHIGNQLLEIEVMGESYDSIGSRVIRHFRHYINGSRHIWLKGDFVDPSMSPQTIHPSPEQETRVALESGASSSSHEPLTETSTRQTSYQSDIEKVGTPHHAHRNVEDVVMETEVSSEKKEKTVSEEEGGMIVTDSVVNITHPVIVQEVKPAGHRMEDVVPEMSQTYTQEASGEEEEEEEESQEDRVVEVIPVEGEDEDCVNKRTDQVDGMTIQTDLVVSSLGRPRQRCLLYEQQRVLSGIQIYEGTSRAGKKRKRKLNQSDFPLDSSQPENGDENSILEGQSVHLLDKKTGVDHGLEYIDVDTSS